MASGLLAWTANNAVLKPTCRLFHLLIIALFLTTTVLATTDTILPSAASASFPECGLSCPQLQQAADSCLASPEDTHAVHVSCFCQSSLLSQLKTSPDGTCDSSCTSETDRQLLQAWYTSYCNSGGNTGGTSGAATTTVTSGAAASTSSSSSNAQAQPKEAKPKTWWDGHYKWVIMVIVLIIAFSIIAAVATWLKKRHDAKYPNLYHGVGGSGSGTESGLFAGRVRDQSPGPGHPGQFSSNLGGLAPPPRSSYPNSDSIASSSRTEVVPPKSRSGHPSSRLAKTPQSADDDIEIREVTR
ncbi:hypothetical protein CNMCM8927_007157 [Aspergillus lentulus]|uniref:Integral membrane protein n=1 Tax=Aspergillus lentulus TaxID=293939 RepID=A0AAN5YP71_ASPLE|nr:hypothetical protein CNMCM6069_008355 [Aspergillus lentulus]KAF4173850.1 hypothetical protein CNMCM8060_009398 [Aspergillus lentulus]KAF4184680.1 hypothetical protein CNMCM7927_007622 [Aspergillus lentulus]KAF4193375.1 hypothetical protein CNMCM8694_008903 [Aspergillus lentulus]KAF4204650.1 hypothetical protein CNMCM8927_007157 [Aspergillus lentulus]